MSDQWEIVCAALNTAITNHLKWPLNGHFVYWEPNP